MRCGYPPQVIPMRVTRHLVSISLLAAASACVGRHHQSTTSSTVYEAPVKRDPYLISKEELEDPQIYSRDALTAIRHLRPAFFTYHGPNSFIASSAGATHLSLDYGPLQGTDALKRMNTYGMIGVRYLNAEEAQARFGLNANGGPVIVVLYNEEQ
jgi:hypothetical protein